MSNVNENEDVVPVQVVKECTPNAGRLIMALRETAGYNAYTIISDLIDNCLDADAKNIDILIRSRKGNPQIVIADDGCGMDEETLHEALRLGSNLQKDKMIDMGCFGMGMKVAAFAIGKKLTVMTAKDSNWMKAVLDINHIVDKDKWEILFSGLNNDDNKLLISDDINIYKQNKNQGTVIILDELDRFNISNANQTANTLKKHVSRIFWKKISEGIKIKINNEIVEAYDPLEWEDMVVKKVAQPRITPESDEIEVKYTDEYGIEKKSIIVYKMISFPGDDEADPNRNKRQDIFPSNNRNCGIIVYRNGREVANGETLNMFQKHSTHHSIRIALYFKADELDYAMGTSFNKANSYSAEMGRHAGRIQQSVFDAICPIVKSFATRVTKSCNNRQLEKTADDVQKVHDSASRSIGEKARALSLPKVPESKEKRDEKNKEGTRKSTGKGSPRGLGTKVQNGILSKCEWRTAKLSKEGPIYTADREGQKMIITWNSEHPIYMVMTSNDDSKAKSSILLLDYFIHAMACAEIHYQHNTDISSENGFIEPIEIIQKFKNDLTNNLRILLS